MRTFLTSALLLLACGVAGGCADRSSRSHGDGAPLVIPDGPDPVVLRVPQDGGRIAVSPYPAIDSTIWRSTSRTEPLSRVVAFGSEDGYLAAVDTAGSPVRIDLRMGTVTTNRGAAMRYLSSADGSTIYGVNSSGLVSRFSPSGAEWEFKPAHPVDAVLPQQDGSVLLIGAEPGSVIVRRIRPPNSSVSDSVIIKSSSDPAQVRKTLSATAVTTGDRVYFAIGERVIALRSRDLGEALNVGLGDPVRALAATPSGDRVFVAIEDKPVLRIVDRFEESVTGKVRLSAPASELRMDPMGRVVLARIATDSLEIVSVSGERVTDGVRSDWRKDLPMVMPDGAVAVARGKDAVLLNPWSLETMKTVSDGARQFWFVFRWNGFRPRAAGLDQPVEFRNSYQRESAFDSLSSSQIPPHESDSVVRSGGTDTASVERSEYNISFAALLDERQARALASRIRIEGRSPRVTTTERDGTIVYRVIMGPFSSRSEADRIGRMSGHDYWVFEGSP